MSAAHLAFVAFGGLVAALGFGLQVAALRPYRGGQQREPKHVAMLIGGIMLSAFGVVLAGFAIGFDRTAPLDLNAAVPAP